MKNKILSIVLSIFGILVLCGGIYFIKRGENAKDSGCITVNIININNETLKSKEIAYNEGDKLVDLLDDHFENFVVQNGMVISIDSLTTPSSWETFILVYKNGTLSNVGILEMNFSNGDIISFVESNTM